MTPFTILLCVMASQATLLFSFGYDSCILLLSATTVMEQDLKLTVEESKHFTTDAKYGLLLACMASGFIADFLGRRRTLTLSAALSGVGFLTMALSTSYALLITGRLISLIGLGLGLPITPLYICEVASPPHRGYLTTIPEIFWTLGLWLAVISRATVSGFSPTLQWRLFLGVGVVPSLILGIGMAFMPESPCWLIMHGRIADTKTTLQRTLKTAADVDTRLSALRTAAHVPPTASNDELRARVPQNVHFLAIWDELVRPRSFVTTSAKALISVMSLHFAQQATGIDLFTTETMTLFRAHEPTDMPLRFVVEQGPFLCARLSLIAAPLLLSDTVKRQPLILISSMCVMVSLWVMNISSISFHEDTNIYTRGAEEGKRWGMVGFFASYSVGLGPLTWVHTPEAFPFKIRAQLVGIIVMLGRLMGMGLYYLKSEMDTHATIVRDSLYWLLIIVLALGTVLIAKYFVETSQRSLEELDQLPRGSTIELS